MFLLEKPFFFEYGINKFSFEILFASFCRLHETCFYFMVYTLANCFHFICTILTTYISDELAETTNDNVCEVTFDFR